MAVVLPSIVELLVSFSSHHNGRGLHVQVLYNWCSSKIDTSTAREVLEEIATGVVRLSLH